MQPEKILEKIQAHDPAVLGSKDFSKYAILLPLLERNGEIHIVFEVRAHTLRRQPGEICFPGGRIDAGDATPQAAALRETREELGIRSEEISAVYPLDYMVSPFGMIIYAFAGTIDAEAEFKPNPSEVDSLFSVPLSFFLETRPEIYYMNFNIQPEENFPYDLIEGGQDYSFQPRQMEEYFYLYEDKVIWGLTARILAHFMEIIR
ncbi:CoA pyrophosphatase [Planococcus sp. 107-1]|uniref:NUDIX hydrolase n=1 Tax=Planococcus sp. 107-1 TaxID=2908840 RepID=UPI001F1E0B9A|nr:CoA pyrophosphatase [Planococcus sp. 107-1]UJF26879.1 CoA pyrophosphatase [Planococcus sp. 107-1]